MKKKFTSMACGIAAASILSLALTACDNDSPSAPTGGDEKSSAVENSDAGDVSSSSDKVVASSDAGDVSSSSEGATVRCDALSTECGYTEEELCERGVPGYCGNELVEVSSSSEAGQSSSSFLAVCNAFMPECGYTEEELCGMGYTSYCKISSSSEVASSSSEIDICPPGGDCDGDGIPDGIRRPDLEPCDTDTLLEFYGRAYQCVNNKWVYLPPPITYINENATDVSAMGRGGPAVSPRVVKVQSASGSVTFRDDGVLVDDNCTFNGLNAELRGDTLYATILYPGCSTTGGHMGVITFTLGIDFADVKYIKYDGNKNVKPVFEADELLPCGNTSSCNTCGGDGDSLRVGC